MRPGWSSITALADSDADREPERMPETKACQAVEPGERDAHLGTSSGNRLTELQGTVADEFGVPVSHGL